MRSGNPVRIAGHYEGELPVRNVVIASAALVYGALWIIGAFTGALDGLRHVIRPYMPDWLALSILLLSPVTLALAELRTTGLVTSLMSAVVFGFQAAVMGLAARDHPVVSAMVTLFLYVEAFSLIPRLNRRTSGKNQYTTLNLEQSSQKASRR